MAPTLVLLHGFTHTGASWEPVVATLAERYRAVAPDIRGHGRAWARRPVSLAAVIDDIAALTREPITLVGYSMGGRIALHAALDPRIAVQRLVVIGASPGIADPVERRQRCDDDEGLASELESSTIEVFATRWAGTPVLAGAAPEVAAHAHADRLRNTPAGLAAALRGLGTGALPSLWGRLAEIRVPVMLVVGERDAKFCAIAAQMTQSLPRARLVVVPRAGHAVHLEAPAIVAELICQAQDGGN